MTPLPQRRRKEGSLLPSFPAPQTIKVPKAVSDSFVVFEIYLKVIQRNLVAFVLMMPAFPLVFLIFARSLTPDGTEISSRLVTGSIVFGLGITTVNNLSQAILNDRFTFRLKLLVASPIHPLSYAAGVVAFNSLYGLAMAAAILLFAPLFGIGIQLSLWLIPLMLFTVVSLTGIALIIATWSPPAQLGNMLANTVGIMVVMLSPIYYEIDRLPGWLQGPAHLSPYTHAGNAIDGVLSGGGVLYGEMGILAAISAATLAIGIAGMRWREA